MEYTVIVPVLNEAESIIELCERVYNVFDSMGKGKDFEILFVDDGSTDKSRYLIKRLCAERSYVRGIFFRKNSGKSFALATGFMYTRGNCIITMDGDLQDSPEDIPRMIEKMKEGYGLVVGWRKKRRDGKIRMWGSWLFNKIVSYFGGIKLHDFNCGFKVCRVDVIRAISVYGQYHRFIPLLAHFMGFKVTELLVINDKRKYGISKYRTFRYHGFFDLLSILFIYKYRFSPLYFFGGIGSILIIPSLAIIFYLIFRHTLFVLGIGTNYMAKITLLLPLSTTLCVLGVSIFLVGFVCDFILYHQSKENFFKSAKILIEEIVG